MSARSAIYRKLLLLRTVYITNYNKVIIYQYDSKRKQF